MTAAEKSRSPRTAGDVRSPARRNALLFGLAVLLVTFLLIRTFRLGADPDYSWLPQDVGYLIDEGFKTLEPRNLLLFDQRQWNEFDQYSGWMEASPITQWPFYFSFKWFGLDRTSARWVNVTFFGLLLVGATLYFIRRYDVLGALLGTTLIGLDVALFQFSRIAIFEIAVCLFVYAAVLGAAAFWENNRRILALNLAAVLGTVGVFGVKLSVLFYLSPAIAALAAVLIFERMRERGFFLRPVNLEATTIVLVLAAALYLIYATRHQWGTRVDLSRWVTDPDDILFNPMHQLSPLALAVSLIATIDLTLSAEVRTFVKNPLLPMTAAIVISVPILLGGFSYNPERYYVAVVPAALLLTVEWCHLKWTGRLPSDYRFTTGRVLTVIPLSLLTFATLMQYGGHSFFPLLEFLPQGEAPGIGQSTLETVFPIVAGVGLLVAGLLAARRRLKPVIETGAMLGIGVHLVASLLVITSALKNATYVTEEIESEITQRVKVGETVGGERAPYFLLETDVPVLFVVEGQNEASDMERLRLDYFLNSNSRWDRKSLQELRDNPAVRVTSNEKVGTIFGNEMLLHRLEY